jgi:hypothetical protein
LARTELWFPAGERRPATINIPDMQEISAKSMRKRRPIKSTMEVPIRAPVKLVTELTKLRTRWRSGLVIPAAWRREGRK